MPREVFRDTGHNIIEIVDSDSEQETLRALKQSKHQPATATRRDHNPFVLAPSKNSSQKSSSLTIRRPVEIIELSSSSDEDISERSPSKKFAQSISQHNGRQQSTPARVLGTAQALTGKTFATPARRKYIIASSDDESEDEKRNVPPTALPGKLGAPGSHSNTIPQSLRRADIKVGGDGIIQYVPTPRRGPAPFVTSVSTLGQDDASPLRAFNPAERRRTLLQPDSPRAAIEDLSWEHEQDELGGVGSGAMLIRLSGEAPSSPSKRFTNDIDPQSSPNKTSRRKKMPEAVASLHRLAIPYLKELDERVFGNKLGAHHLPEIEPLPPGKKKRGQTEGVIWGMGTRGEYNDGNGSYIELVWSNKMTTTAGRTEYKKTPQQQVATKIELGVKVIANEERLRNTLAHEACHAASWAISGDFKQPHGRTFKSWAAKVMAAFPDVEVTTKHDYEIDYKFSWECLSSTCGHVFQRHSNSINLEKQGCFCGSKLQPRFQSPVKKTPLRQPAASLLNSAALGNENTRASPSPLALRDGAENLLSDSFTAMALSTASDVVTSRAFGANHQNSLEGPSESMLGHLISRLTIS